MSKLYCVARYLLGSLALATALLSGSVFLCQAEEGAVSGTVESFYNKNTGNAASSADSAGAKNVPGQGGKVSGAILRDIQEKGFATVHIQFEFDRASIAEASQEQVGAIYEVLRTQGNLCLRIDGHTDGTGDKAYNKDLSQRRAEAIKVALVKLGVEENRLQAQGLGSDTPVADNATAEGRAQNRRVELHKIDCQ